MNKNVIKTFAIESRRKMIESVKYQASLIGITAERISEPISKAEGMETYDYGAGTHTIFDKDIKKRESLVKEINYKDFDNVVEEVAYTWFNRIIAIRYLEVNNYLPTRTRVLSSDFEGKIEPDIVTDALEVDLNYTNDDKELIIKLKNENELDDLFQFLFIKQCNQLNNILPGLFEKTDDYMELLLNISFVGEQGVIRQLVDNISEDDFRNQVEIIGWLYQFYNSELKDETFANLKKKIKISKERIPAATQLFTPDWIVKYMVENSVGRLWIEGHPNDELKSTWKFYIEDIEQDKSAKNNFEILKKDYINLMPEDIKIIDPCMGSAHILTYVIDILMQIYLSVGYSEKEAIVFILTKNLYGIDIDFRAYQLAYFAVMMKSKEYNRNILNYNLNPFLSPIYESNNISSEFIEIIVKKLPNFKESINYIIDSFYDAKDYGSMIKLKDKDFYNLKKELLDMFNETKNELLFLNLIPDFNLFINLLNQAILLSQNYDIVITNPPYMASKSMNEKLRKWTSEKYPKSKFDLFSIFIERCELMLKPNRFLSMITQQSFMFLSSFEKLRYDFLKNTILNMIHLGSGAFEEIGGEVVQTTSFVLLNEHIDNYKNVFIRLVNENFKEKSFFNKDNYFISSQSDFSKIPSSPMAYNANQDIIEIFKKEKLDKFLEPKSGIMTGNDAYFVKFWYEVDFNKIGFNCYSYEDMLKYNYKWYPLTRGGNYRKWYGNLEHVVNLENDAYEIKNSGNNFRLRDSKYYFKEGLTWTMITTKNLSIRYVPEGILFGNGGPTCFVNEHLYYFMALLNSAIVNEMISFMNPTLNIVIKDIKSLPVIEQYDNAIDELVKENISISKENWNLSETSWEFEKHFLLKFKEDNLIEHAFVSFNNYFDHSFNKLKNNEEELNKIFLKIYNLEGIDYTISDALISLDKYDCKESITSFISYAIGCMFGRYSLDEPGIIFSGGIFNLNRYHQFIPDADNIIPVLDTEYFEDDIVERFVEFVKICFGEESLEKNLDFIAGALNKKGKTSREIIRNYLLSDFFNDHSKKYNKCPIYWQFDSGKQNAFKCLIYMHRYEPDIIARVRTDYLHKTQKAIEQNLSHCDSVISNSSNKSEVSRATKDKSKYIKQLDEIKVYDEALRHMATQNIEIDLDDGVKDNYAKFQKIEISKEGEKSKKINLLKNI